MAGDISLHMLIRESCRGSPGPVKLCKAFLLLFYCHLSLVALLCVFISYVDLQGKVRG